MNKFLYGKFGFALILASSLGLTSCLSDGDNTIVLEKGNSTGIPDDSKATQNPIITNTTTQIPNINYTVSTEGNDAIVNIEMTGIQEAGTFDWLKLYGTSNNEQNIWVSVDGKPKGISVINNSDEENDEKMKADLVFIVDNSGSMSEEADAIARDIISWTQKLEASNIDIKFGCVGYDGSITGAVNMGDASAMSTFLNRSTGTSRTMGFYGSDKEALQKSASSYFVDNGMDENGSAAIQYGDHNMNFRTGANRIYVNFTDEPNYPCGKNQFSTEFFKDQKNWSSLQGTVHTVYSSDTTYAYKYEKLYSQERPWRMSWYTGGTILVAPSNFKGITLESLPVTGAMQNSYTIRFTNVSEFMDGKPHLVKITIMSKDGKTCAERSFYVTFGTK